MSLAPAIEVRGLVKKYGEKVAVSGIDLTVEQGTPMVVIQSGRCWHPEELLPDLPVITGMMFFTCPEHLI